MNYFWILVIAYQIALEDISLIHQITKDVNAHMTIHVIYAQMKVLKWVYVLHATTKKNFMKNQMILMKILHLLDVIKNKMDII